MPPVSSNWWQALCPWVGHCHHHLSPACMYRCHEAFCPLGGAGEPGGVITAIGDHPFGGVRSASRADALVQSLPLPAALPLPRRQPCIPLHHSGPARRAAPPQAHGCLTPLRLTPLPVPHGAWEKTHMAWFSMKITRLAGSVPNAKQQPDRYGRVPATGFVSIAQGVGLEIRVQPEVMSLAVEAGDDGPACGVSRCTARRGSRSPSKSRVGGPFARASKRRITLSVSSTASFPARLRRSVRPSRDAVRYRAGEAPPSATKTCGTVPAWLARTATATGGGRTTTALAIPRTSTTTSPDTIHPERSRVSGDMATLFSGTRPFALHCRTN